MNFIKTGLSRIKSAHWRWHWLDGLVLLTIIIALSGLLWMRVQRKTQWIPVKIEIAQEEWWWEGAGPKYWYLDNLKVGSVGYDSFSTEVAKVEKLELVDVGKGRQRAVVWVQLKVNYDAKSQQYFFGFQPLQVGRGVELSFSKQQLKGLVTSVDQATLPVVERSVKVWIDSVDPHIAATYRVGLQSFTTTGEVIATITKLKVAPALKDEYSDIRNKIVRAVDPVKVSVTAVVKLRLTKDGERYYFADDLPVKIGSDLPLQFAENSFQSAQVLEWMDEPVPLKP